MAIRIHTPSIVPTSTIAAKEGGLKTAGTGPAERIAYALKAALAPLRQLAGACHLALAKAVGARDYNTARAGSEVRNVMTIEQAICADLLRPDQIHSPRPAHNAFDASGLASLIAGREFIAITHGEGPDAQVSVIFNDSVNKHLPTALTVWREGREVEVLMTGDLASITRNPRDRLVLGPLKYQATRNADSGIYHEVQRNLDCAIHAANAMVGRPLLNKAELDKILIDIKLTHFADANLSEDDFYLNTPANPNLEHLCDIDHGIQGDELAEVLNRLLPDQIKHYRPPANTEGLEGMRQADLLNLAEKATDHAKGCILLHNDHFIAFRRADTDARWRMINSTQSDTPVLSPFDYLNKHVSQEYRELLTWEPDNARISRH